MGFGYPSKVALFLGFLAYREIAKAFASQGGADAQKQALYRDCAILKARLGKPLPKGAIVPSTAEIADFLKALYHRTTFRTHTLTPDTEDWDRWLLAYIDWYQADQRYLDQLSGIYLAPSSEFKTHNAGKTFFDPEDRLVVTANDASIRELDVRTAARQETAGNSLYTTTLAKIVLAFASLDDYFHGHMDRQDFVTTYMSS